MPIITIANVIAMLLAFLFAAAGLVNVIAPVALRNAYRRWQFSPGFNYVAGTAMLLAALFLAVPETRIWGGILGGMILFVATVSLLNHSRYLCAVPTILVMAALVPAMAGSL